MLDMVLNKAHNGVRISHANTVDVREVKKQLSVLDDKADLLFDTIIANYNHAANKPARLVDVAINTCELFTPDFHKLDDYEQHKIAKSERIKRVVELANGSALGSHSISANGTAWGWVNAVTQYVDHEARASTPSHRLNSAWFGNGNRLKNRALEMALEPERFTYRDVATTRDALLLDAILT